MTAYELADALQQTEPYYLEDDKLFDKSAAMLRQQADRIAELEKKTKPLNDEEIIKIFNQIWNDGGNTNGVMHRFARAIEERHGIK